MNIRINSAPTIVGACGCVASAGPLFRIDCGCAPAYSDSVSMHSLGLASVALRFGILSLSQNTHDDHVAIIRDPAPIIIVNLVGFVERNVW